MAPSGSRTASRLEASRQVFVTFLGALRTPWWGLGAYGLVVATVTVLAWRHEVPTAGWAVPAAGIVLGATGWLARRLGLRWPTIVLLLAAVLVYLGYATYTDLGERNYDGPHHLAYIRYLADHGSLPPRDYNLICHHPPLYHALAALALLAARAAGVADPVPLLQLLSVVLFVAFLLFAALIFERLIPRAPWRYLATALVAFWPSSIINAVRINNDTLLYPVMAAGMYHLLCWTQTRERSSLIYATVLGVLALLTKVNGAILLALIALALGAALGEPSRRRAVWRQAAAPVCALAIAVAGFATWRLAQQHEGTLDAAVGAAADLSKGVAVTATDSGFYFYLDVEIFLRQPHVLNRTMRHNPDRPTIDGGYFWNHLIKSSLLGTRNFYTRVIHGPETDFSPNRHLAQLMNFLLLAMCAFALTSALLAGKAAVRAHLPELMVSGVFLAASLGFHILVPRYHHADFRFIFPVLVPAAVLYARAIELHRQRDSALGLVGVALAIGMVVVSVVYFLPSWQALVS